MSESPPHPAAANLRTCAAYHLIPFTPVPVKPRHDGWTPDRQRGFIDRLCVTGCVSRSARAVGRTPQSAYRLREHPEAASFARAWSQALADGRSYQLDCAIERAVIGEVTSITYAGRVVGERRHFDNRLTIAVLRALDRRTGATENKG